MRLFKILTAADLTTVPTLVDGVLNIFQAGLALQWDGKVSAHGGSVASVAETLGKVRFTYTPANSTVMKFVLIQHQGYGPNVDIKTETIQITTDATATDAEIKAAIVAQVTGYGFHVTFTTGTNQIDITATAGYPRLYLGYANSAFTTATQNVAWVESKGKYTDLIASGVKGTPILSGELAGISTTASYTQIMLTFNTAMPAASGNTTRELNTDYVILIDEASTNYTAWIAALNTIMTTPTAIEFGTIPNPT